MTDLNEVAKAVADLETFDAGNSHDFRSHFDSLRILLEYCKARLAADQSTESTP